MEPFDWNRILIDELPWGFLPEVVFRSVIMYVFILVVFRLMGKRQIKRFSVFEAVLILGLGTVVSTPMFNETESLLPALTALVTIALLYYSINWISLRSRKTERTLEGRTYCIYSEGKIETDRLYKEKISNEELFSELRERHIEHLGQVRRIYLEFSGKISVFYSKEEEVKYGLGILPDHPKESNAIDEDGYYSCTKCAFTKHIQQPGPYKCSNCGNRTASRSSNSVRIL